jgi:hypothetical protein
VQCRDVDHHVGSLQRAAAQAGVSQVADQLCAWPGGHVGAADSPARRLGYRGDGAADRAGAAGDQDHSVTATLVISLGGSASHGLLILTG